jgi:hypothetical protein
MNVPGTENIPEQIPSEDLIDQKLADLAEEMIGQDGDEEDFDAASDIIFEVIESLVDEEKIEEIPEGVSSEDQQSWITKYFIMVKDGIHAALNDGFTGDQDDSDPSI